MTTQVREKRQSESNGSPETFSLRILNAIRQIIRAVDIDSRKLASEHDITSPQLLCLMAVVEKGTTTAIDVAKRIHLGASTLVGVLDRLESKGLIQRHRSSDDRREIEITATEGGQKLAATTPFPLQYSLGTALEQLSESEQNEVACWMERLVDLMGANEINAGPMLEIAALGQRERKSKGNCKRKGRAQLG